MTDRQDEHPGPDSAHNPSGPPAPEGAGAGLAPAAAPDAVPTLSASGAPPAAGAATRPMPESIGEYKILGLLGQGGMGVVWEAEQQHPRRRPS